MYHLQHFNLVRAPESFISGDFICLILAFISSPLSTFLSDVRRENSKVNQRLVFDWCYCVKKADVLSL